MNIVGLKVSNVKRIRAVEIAPRPAGVTVIGGRNGQGKSSALDAVAYAFGGAALIPPDPIRHGENEAYVEVRLDNGAVKRTWKRREDGSIATALEFRDASGNRFSSPQTALQRLVAGETLDPMEFFSLKPAEQRSRMLALVGIDAALNGLYRARELAYERRRIANAELVRLDAALAAPENQADPNAPDEPLSAAQLMEDLKFAENANAAIDAKRKESVKLGNVIMAIKNDIERIEDQLRAARAALAETEAKKAEHDKELAQLEPFDVTPIRQRLVELDVVNARVATKRRRAEIKARHAAAIESQRAHQSEIDGIDRERDRLAGEAQWPVPGLGFNETGPTINGVPFEQASHSERVRISAAMAVCAARRRNPAMSVILIRDGALLDKESLAALDEEMRRLDVQALVECVGDAGDGGFIIEDGEAKGGAS